MSSRRPSREPVESDTLDRVFSALGHPARRRILIVLHARGGEMGAGEINDRFRHSWPTTTRHLGVLRDAGLVRVREKGRRRLYTLDRTPLRDSTGWLASWVEPASSALEGDRDWRALPYASLRNATPPATDVSSSSGKESAGSS